MKSHTWHAANQMNKATHDELARVTGVPDKAQSLRTLVEFKRLQQTNPMAAAAYHQANHLAIANGHLVVDALNEAAEGPVSAADALAIVEGLEPNDA